MKTLTLFLLLWTPVLPGFAQDIGVTFSGTATSVLIDSVTAANLATGQSVTLPGNATLFLTPKTGISSLPVRATNGFIFPNPFPGRCTFIVSAEAQQQVQIRIRNLVGQVVAQTLAFVEPGENGFELSVPGEGIYLITLTKGPEFASFKVISTGASGSGGGIRYSGTVPSGSHSGFKDGFGGYNLGYSPGDTIRYRCRSGEFTAVFSDSPKESRNYQVEFPPIARFVINPADSGSTETIFELDASISTDALTPVADLEVRWDLDNDGNWDTDFNPEKTFIMQFQDSGKYPITLEVKNAAGLLDTRKREALVTLAPEGTFRDRRDGNRYPFKTIGTQVWMTKNMAWLPFVSEALHPSATEKCYYVHSFNGSVTDAKRTAYYNTYGVLYNGVAARDACPAGWHCATDEEWKTLEKFLGMSQISADSLVPTGYRNSGKVGAQLKETGTAYWKDPNVGATNSSGFSARGASIYFAPDMSFLEIGWPGYFWTSTANSTQEAYARGLYNWAEGIGRYSEILHYGFSVRCIRD